jgi:hypothetical protein
MTRAIVAASSRRVGKTGVLLGMPGATPLSEKTDVLLR